MKDIGKIDKYYSNLGKTIIGIDECGRGCIAGHCYIGLATMKDTSSYDVISKLGLDDSKNLSSKRRFELEDQIKDNFYYRVLKLTVDEINTGKNLNDLIYITINKGLSNYDGDEYIVFMDGNQKIKNCKFSQYIQPKLDGLSWHVAAASILAKNEQVRAMQVLDKLYPEYDFINHNGYARPAHKEAIKKYGILDCHRKKWIK